ncbi:MAG TPA: LpxD N-terminal domain-containing protein, partial [Pyrinomonadaceae bacterium]
MKLREIAELVGGELIGDGDVEIMSVADISRAQPGQLAFFEKDEELPATNATCVIVAPDGNASVTKRASTDAATPAETRAVASVPLIITDNPKLAFAKAAGILHPLSTRTGHHGSAVIADSAEIGEATQIHAGARISE